jgi:hypothetical protein
MNRTEIAALLNKIFGWGVYICLIAGGLAFFGFLAGIIIGGPSAEALAVFIQKKYFPVVIRATSITIGIGLIGMYFGKMQALSLAAEKQKADMELAEIKK